MEDFICPICYEQRDHFITLHESCSFCTSCLTDWVTIEIDEKNLSINGQLTCPMSTCNQKAPINQVLPGLELEQTKTVYDAFFKKYLLKSSDVIKCPQSNCDYAGFTTAKHFGCKKPFICEVCGNDWNHPTALGTSDGFFTRMLTELRKEFIAKRCPRCGIFISRNQGCNHMHCTVCNTDFQWNEASYRGWFVVRIIVAVILLLLLAIYMKQVWAYVKEHKEFFITATEYIALYFGIPLWIMLQSFYHSFIIKRSPFKRCNQHVRGLFDLILHIIPFAIILTLFILFPGFAKAVGITFLVYVAVGCLFTTFMICLMVVVLAQRERRGRQPPAELFNPEEEQLLLAIDNLNDEVIPLLSVQEENKDNSENQQNTGQVENLQIQPGGVHKENNIHTDELIIMIPDQN